MRLKLYEDAIKAKAQKKKGRRNRLNHLEKEL